MEGLFAPWHIAIVLVIALLVFGPKQLPQMGHSLGKSINGFRQGLQGAKDEFSGVMKEGTETAEPLQTTVANPTAPAGPAAAVTAEPAKETVEQPADPPVAV
jgi:sec-independent protein translocase protein TatA